MKRIQLVFILLTLHLFCYGQTDVLLTQQMFSRMNFNPAATGTSGYTNIFFLSRMQWVGIEGAPNSQYLDVHQYMPKIKSGLGVSFVHDAVGLEQYDNMKVAYAHHVRISPEDNLSLGFGAGFGYHGINNKKIYEQSAPSNIYKAESKFFPDFDFGMEYEHKDLLLGFSMTHVSNNPESTKELQPIRHIYAYAQYRYELNHWEWMPSITMINSINTFNIDLSLVATYNHNFWVGTAFRSNEKVEGTSISVLAGLWLTSSWRLGYAYDFSFSNQVARNSGTHEICIIYTLGYTQKNVISPRLF